MSAAPVLRWWHQDSPTVMLDPASPGVAELARLLSGAPTMLTDELVNAITELHEMTATIPNKPRRWDPPLSWKPPAA